VTYVPPVPKHTCPDIDSVIDALKKLEELKEAMDTALSGGDHVATMEQLRSANDSLRKNYEAQEERADEAESRAEELEAKVELLEAEVADLHERLSSPIRVTGATMTDSREAAA
jgi:predicted nuclease with TOPRIM domain